MPRFCSFCAPIWLFMRMTTTAKLEENLMVLSFFFFSFLIGEKLLYNVVLVSVIQQWKSIIITYILSLSSWWLNGKESTCQCRSHGFNPGVRKIPWRRKQSKVLKWQGTQQIISTGNCNVMELHETFLGKVFILWRCSQENVSKCRLWEKAWCDFS